MDTIKSTLWGEGNSNTATTIDAVGAVAGNESACPSLSFKHRIIGFISCTTLGILLSILGTVFLFMLNFIAFGVLYCIGNIVTVIGTLFLQGPVKQVKAMFDKSRVISTVVWLITLVLTLILAFTVQVPVLIVVFVIIQSLAFAWYSISYIPFAHKAIIGCVKGIL
uniref:Vesicle transport protein n=1 Tax=Arcella intermedia TaxID=1963864 RepID=A0A6B2LMD1_9EUKA|eukprot:TRINITY_DN24264_c0_g1_i1.p1 TRINITY_DN24264_c0_g1~~TRINITY_DN24264_c0_g1_i1.p1  ORF type:complete len:166 (+),score=15.89 TRINITY_DN24264_c0_g1_i1:15-512(+)